MEPRLRWSPPRHLRAFSCPWRGESRNSSHMARTVGRVPAGQLPTCFLASSRSRSLDCSHLCSGPRGPRILVLRALLVLSIILHVHAEKLGDQKMATSEGTVLWIMMTIYGVPWGKALFRHTGRALQLVLLRCNSPSTSVTDFVAVETSVRNRMICSSPTCKNISVEQVSPVILYNLSRPKTFY